MDGCQALLEAITAAREVMGSSPSPRRQIKVLPAEDTESTEGGGFAAEDGDRGVRSHELLAELDRTRKAARRRIGGLQTELAQAKAHHREQSAATAELERLLSEARHRESDLRRDVEASRATAAQLQQRLDAELSRDVATELTVARTELATYRERLREAEVKLSVADIKTAELQSLAYAASGDERVALLRQQVHELSAENVSRDKLVSAKDALLADVRGRLQRESEAKCQLLAELDQVRHELDARAREESSLRASISVKDGIIAQARADARDARALYNDALAQRDIDETQATIREETLRNLMSEAQRESEALRGDLQARDQVILRLQRSLAVAEQAASEADDRRVLAVQQALTARQVVSGQLLQQTVTARARSAFVVWHQLVAAANSRRHADELFACEARVSALTDRSAALEKEAVELRRAVDAEKAAASRSQEDHELEVDTLLRRIHELETALAAEHAAGAARAKSVSDQHAVLESALRDVESSRERDTREFRGNMDKYKAEVQRLTAQLSQERQAVRDAMDKAESEHRATKEELAAAKREAAAANRNVTALRQEVEVLGDLCRAREGAPSGGDGGATGAERSATVVVLEAKLSNAEKALAAMQQELDQARTVAATAIEERALALAAATATVFVAAAPAAEPATSQPEAQTMTMIAEELVAERVAAAVEQVRHEAAREVHAAQEAARLLRDRLSRSEERRRLEAAALKDLIAGLEASHLDEVRSLVVTASAAQLEAELAAASVASPIAQSMPMPAEMDAARSGASRTRAQGGDASRRRAVACATLQRQSNRQLAWARFSQWVTLTLLRRTRHVERQASQSIAQLNAAISKVTAIAEAAVVENRSLKATLAKPRETQATQTVEDADLTRCKAQLLDLHQKAKMSSEIMATAKTQLTAMATDLKATKQREAALAERVRELSVALEAEMAHARRLKDEFIAFLGSPGGDEASPGLHHHDHHPVASTVSKSGPTRLAHDGASSARAHPTTPRR